MSEEIACSQAEIKYKTCPKYQTEQTQTTQTTRANSKQMYQEIFNKQLELYQSLRNSNKTLHAAVDPLQNYAKYLNSKITNTNSNLDEIKTQINSFENTIREFVPTKPKSGAFGIKNTDSGIQFGFYVFFFFFLLTCYFYYSSIINPNTFSFTTFIGVFVGSLLAVYFVNMFINKYSVYVSYDPTKITSSVQSFFFNKGGN
jgi:hypothetical protein